MITCPNCNKELEDGAKFCNGCGSKITSETPVVENTPVYDTTTVSEKKENPLNGIVEKLKTLPVKKLAIGGGVIVAVILVIVLLSNILSSGKEVNYTVYIKDDELCINLLNGKESIEISSDFAGDYNATELYNRAYALTQITPDGKTVIFPDKFDTNNYAFDLYYRSATKEKADAEKIASDVYSYVLSDDGKKIVYMCEKGLYEYNFKESEKIDGDANSYWTTDDCKTILYIDNDGTLYKKTFGKDDAEKLEKDVVVKAVSEDLKTVVFTKEDSLYIKEGTKDKEKIDKDITNVIQAYNNGNVYYVKTEYNTMTLDQYVNDDMASTDAAMVRPTSPSYYDFEWPKSPSMYSFSSYYWEDLEEYAGCASYDEAKALYDTLYEEVNAEYEAAQTAYNEAYEIWASKNTRDNIRERLAEWEIETTKYSLWYYDGKEAVCVVEDFTYNSSYDASLADQDPIMAIAVKETGEVSKINISEIESIYDAEDAIEEMLQATATPAIVTGATVTKIDAEDASFFTLSADAKNVFFFTDVDDYMYGTLNKASVSNGSVEKVDEDVVRGAVLTYEDGDYVYFKDLSDDYNQATLYVNGKKAAEDVYGASLKSAQNADKLYYLSDVSNNEGTLYYYNGKENKIAKDVFTSITVTADGGVLYFEDYDSDSYEGELFYSENGKEGKMIDDDVTIVVTPYMNN